MTASEDGVFVSTGKTGTFAQALVPAPVDDTLATISKTSKFDLTMPQVLSFVDNDRIAAAVLLDYHRSKVNSKPDVVCPVPDSVRRYQFEVINYNPEAKPMLRGFMSPLVHECFAPDMTIDNEQQAVNGRIIKVRQQELPMLHFLDRTMEEYLELLIPEKYKLVPVDDDELYVRQAKPSQRRILENGQFIKSEPKSQVFLKKEAYPDCKDPRLISQINGCDKAAYSKFIYSFVELLKKQPWYAFGRTPAEIAERVASVCTEAHSITNSDFSRFDGHCSNLTRELEKRALIRAFNQDYHDEISELHRTQYGVKCYGQLGVMYENYYARLSGSPETAAFNGVVNSYITYLSYRMTRINGAYRGPQESWNMLGIYGGDDGLSPDMDGAMYEKAATMMGQKVTYSSIKRGDFGVTFLARYYSPEVWFGDVNSCCDIRRQLSKFHATIVLPPKVRPVDKLMEKCRSFILSDEHTPIIGGFVSRAVQINGAAFEHDSQLASISSWNSHLPKENQYPNSKAEWMWDLLEQQLPGIDVARFNSWLDSTLDLETMLKPPLLLEPLPAKSAVPVVVDGMVIPFGMKIKNYVPPVKDVSFSKYKGKVSKSTVDNWNKSKETFDEYKKRRVAAGTWKEPEKVTETFADFKARRIQEGTWVEKPDVRSKSQTPRGRSGTRKAK
jgi:hypothetical protein